MIRKYDGKDLAKVLVYYGLIDGVSRSDFNINCPFHDDPNPSMSIKLSSGKFYCFGCGLFGDAYNFVKFANPALDELQCCVLLEKILRTDKVKRLDVKYKRDNRKENAGRMLEEAEDYFFGLCPVRWGSSDKTEEQAEIEHYMQNRGFAAKDLFFADCRISSNVTYPVIFPIYDNGNFKGYVCRTMDKRVEQKRKYLYNDGFRKRDTLCGVYHDSEICVVCEGFLDYLSLKSKARLKNVVALLGWHASDEQIKMLQKKNIKIVICALDNPEIDKSGEKGIRLLEKYFKVIPFPYPKGVKDAGEMSVRQLNESIRRIKEKYETCV